MNCPFCEAEITATAQKCRFCGEWIVKPLSDAATPDKEIPATTELSSPIPPRRASLASSSSSEKPVIEPAKSQTGSTCMGCLAIIFVCIIVGTCASNGLNNSLSVSTTSEQITNPLPTPPPPSQEELRRQKAEAKKQVEIAQKQLKAEEAHRKAVEKEEIRKANEEWDQGGLVLLKKSLKVKSGEFGNSFIAGIVENRTGRTLGYAQIVFSLYDKNDNQIGNAMSNVNNLEPGQKWKFEAMVSEENVASYKPSSLSGF